MTTAIKTTPKEFFAKKEVQERFEGMLKENTPAFIISILDIISKSEQLQKVDLNSLMFAAANAASMNLPINPNLGLAYIIPYKGKAQFQMGYKGFKQLGMRSGQFQAMETCKVYAEDTDAIVKTRLTSIIKKPGTGEVIGYVSYFRLLNGFEKTCYMTNEELKKHGKKYSQSYKKGYGLWKDDFDSMAEKTVIKQLLSHDAPLSLEMQKAVLTDQAVLKNWDGNELGYVDNRPKLPLEENNQVKEGARITKWIQESKTSKKLAEVNAGVYASGNQELIDLYEEKALELDVEQLVV